MTSYWLLSVDNNKSERTTTTLITVKIELEYPGLSNLRMGWAVAKTTQVRGRRSEWEQYRREKKRKGQVTWPAICTTLTRKKNKLQLFTHLNYAAIGRVESSRGLGTIHQTPKVRVGDDGLDGILDWRMVLFSLTSLKKREMMTSFFFGLVLKSAIIVQSKPWKGEK